MSDKPELTDLDCPYCHSTTTEGLRKDPVVVRCRECGLPRLYPRISGAGQAAELQRHYATHQYQHVSPLEVARVAPTWEIATIRRIGAIPPSGGRALDIGTGNGYFLVLLNEAGFRSTGIEPYERNVEHGRRHGLDMLAATFDAASLPKEVRQKQYDLITFRGSLCMIPDLSEAFSLVREMLKPGGMLYISTILFSSPYFLTSPYPGRFSFLSPSFPTYAWLQKALQREGFSIVEAQHPRYDLARFFGWPKDRMSFARRVFNRFAPMAFDAIGRHEHVAVFARARP